jgi:hypothetical protein
MLPRFIYDSRQTARHLLGRLATMTSTDGGAARLCLVTQSEDGHVRVNANGARIDDEFELQFSGDSSLSNGVYRVVCRTISSFTPNSPSRSNKDPASFKERAAPRSAERHGPACCNLRLL